MSEDGAVVRDLQASIDKARKALADAAEAETLPSRIAILADAFHHIAWAMHHCGVLEVFEHDQSC